MVVGAILICNMRGRDVAAYRAATEIALRRRFGPAVNAGAPSGYAPILPGQITGCQARLRYTYYPHPTGAMFSVEFYRVADCAHDPMRTTG